MVVMCSAQQEVSLAGQWLESMRISVVRVDQEELQAAVKRSTGSDCFLLDDPAGSISAQRSVVTFSRDPSEGWAQATSGILSYWGEVGSQVPLPYPIASALSIYALVEAVLICLIADETLRLRVDRARALYSCMSTAYAAFSVGEGFDGYHHTGVIDAPERGWRCSDGGVFLFFDSLKNASAFWKAVDLDVPRDSAGLSLDAYRYVDRGKYEDAFVHYSAEDLCQMARRCGGFASPILGSAEGAPYHGVVGGELVPFQVNLGAAANHVESRMRVFPKRDAVAQPGRFAAHPWLAGNRIVEVTAAAAGPFSGHLLSRLGVEVIRFASPGRDILDTVPPFVDGISVVKHFLSDGKTTLYADLKSDEGQQCLREVVSSADAIVQNMAMRVSDGLGVSETAIHKRQPNLPHITIAGFPPNSRFRSEPCIDPIAQAASGFAKPKDADGPEFLRYFTLMDFASGHAATVGVLRALLTQLKGAGSGRYTFKTSLVENAVFLRQYREERRVHRKIANTFGQVWYVESESRVGTWEAVSSLEKESMTMRRRRDLEDEGVLVQEVFDPYRLLGASRDGLHPFSELITWSQESSPMAIGSLPYVNTHDVGFPGEVQS